MSHPDVRRVFALLDGRLDGEARRAFEQHLEGCPACASYRSRVAGLGRLVRETVQGAEPPEIDFDRMETRLMARITAPAPSPALGWLRALVPAAIAAALVLAFSASMRTERSGRSGGGERVAATPRFDPLALQGDPARALVTLLSGKVKLAVHRGEPKRSVTLGSDIREGSVIETAADGSLVVQTALETGFQVAGGSSVELVSLREEGSVLLLDSGRVDSRVKTLPPGGVYRVVAGEFVVEVRGTRFTVARSGATTSVAVTEGVVVVRRRDDPDPAVVARLVAPAQASFRDGEQIAADRIAHEPAADALGLYVLRTFGGTSVLRIPTLADVRRVEVDGMDVGGGGSDVLLRHVRGPAEVVVYPLDGDPIRMTLPVDRSSVTFRMPEATPSMTAPSRPVGRIDRAALSAAMGGYRHQVQRCYDRRLKRVPTLRDRIELVLTIGTDGTVANAVLRSGGHDAEVADCVLRVANRWTFPAPQGGPVTVNVPFSFAPRGRDTEAP